MFHRTILTAAATVVALTGGAMAQTSMPFALDWKFEGPAAPYFTAIDEAVEAHVMFCNQSDLVSGRQ